MDCGMTGMDHQAHSGYRQKKYKPLSVVNSRQRGIVLLVSLIMLLLLTLMGIAGMQDTILQERMVINERDHALATQSAEAALRVAEERVRTAAPVLAAKTSADLLRGGLSEKEYWANSANWAGATAITNLVSADGVAESPKYVIEKMPASYSAIANTRNAGSPTAVETVEDYRITARGVGATTEAVVILQSMYRLVR